MALIVKDRVREITSTTGTGTITLTAAVVGFQSFSVIGDGNTTYYTIVDAATGAFEVGIGTYTASGTTLSRDTVLESSNANALVNFSSGTKDVFVTYPADRSVSQADIGTAPNEIPLNQYLGSAAYVDIETLTAGALTNTTYISETEPTLDLNFAKVKALDPRITFARASEARYYDGKTYAKAEENLFPYGSNITSTNWQYINNAAFATTSDTTAPDGTSTAFKVTSSVTGSGVAVADWNTSSTITAFPRAYSIFAKAAEYNYLVLGGTDTAGFNCVFDLSGGTVFSTGANYTASITSVGNGWYRCSCVATTGSLGYFAVGTSANGSISNTMTAGSGIYIWGAQLEQRSAVSSYTPTTTQPITNYIPTLLSAPANTARFDHDPVTQESLGLLIEEQRTNLATYAEDFADASWTKTNATITANTVVAPDGTLTGDTITATANGADIRKAPSTTNVTHINSIWIKRRKGTGAVAIRNPQGQSSLDITSSLTTQWQRFSSLATLPFGGPLAFVGVVVSVSGDEVDVWGAQCEIGSFSTSYIPTVASQVTRSADAVSMTGTNFSSWYRQDEGSFYLNGSASNIAEGRFIEIINASGSPSNYMYLSSKVLEHFVVVSSGVIQVNIDAGTIVANTPVQTIAAYQVNNFAVCLDNGAVGLDTFGVLPSDTMNIMRIGFSGFGGRTINGTIKKLTYFPKRLDNAELVEMTEQ